MSDKLAIEGFERVGEAILAKDAEISRLQQELAEALAERDDLAMRALTIDEALTNAIHLQRAAEAREKQILAALERLGSNEAFLIPRAVRKGQDDELIARIDFARSVLASKEGGE